MLVAATVTLLIAVPAASNPSSWVAWTLETIHFVRSGNVARGKKLNENCSDCHGAAGTNADMPEVSDLAGQDPLYTYKELEDYKSKLRASDVMNDAVADLSDRDMADLAAFFAAQKPPAGGKIAANAEVLELATVGDGVRMIPACDACHGPRGAGNPGFYGMPRLLGQKPADLSAQLAAFRSGQRTNDVYSVMREVSKKLTDAEIAGLTAYYATPAVREKASSSK
jgi:cytochrome c553